MLRWLRGFLTLATATRENQRDEWKTIDQHGS